MFGVPSSIPPPSAGLALLIGSMHRQERRLVSPFAVGQSLFSGTPSRPRSSGMLFWLFPRRMRENGLVSHARTTAPITPVLIPVQSLSGSQLSLYPKRHGPDRLGRGRSRVCIRECPFVKHRFWTPPVSHSFAFANVPTASLVTF
jgi:hypothetical protein